MRAHRVLGDVEALRDLVRVETLVEQEQHLDLARAQDGGDRVGHAGLATATVAKLLDQPARDRSRERSLSTTDSAQELDDPLGRLALQQVPGRAAPDRREQVLLRP